MKKSIDIKRETNYYMRYSEGLDTTGVSNLAPAEREVTWEQGPIRALLLFTLQRNL